MIQGQTYFDKYGKLDILSMGQINRYSGRLKITQESIAEHSWYVAYCVILVGKDFGLDESIINKAVSLAVVHDIPEIYTNDIPHNIKINFPKIQEEIEKAELAFLDEYQHQFAEYYKELKKDSIESLLVEIADALSVLLYTNKEIELGNKTKDIQIIANEVRSRLTKQFDKLEEKVKEI